MSWLERGMQEHLDAETQASNQAAEVRRQHEAAAAQEDARRREEASRATAPLGEAALRSFDLLDDLGVPGMLRDVQAHWQGGEIVTVDENPKNDPETRVARAFYGLEHVYYGAHIRDTKRTATIVNYRPPATTEERQDPEYRYSSSQSHYQTTVRGEVFDGVYVGVRTKLVPHSPRQRELIVRAFTGAEEPDSYKHFIAGVDGFHSHDLLTVPLGLEPPADLTELRERVQKALAFDTLARERSGRFPATVAQADRRAKAEAVVQHNANLDAEKRY